MVNLRFVYYLKVTFVVAPQWGVEWGSWVVRLISPRINTLLEIFVVSLKNGNLVYQIVDSTPGFLELLLEGNDSRELTFGSQIELLQTWRVERWRAHRRFARLEVLGVLVRLVFVGRGLVM